MNKPRVLVLMATYNGEKYLREQIDSILAQKDVDIFIKVADDRSTDGTAKILQEYKEKYSNFEYAINQNNKGFTYNFLDLYFSVKDEKFDYCAFSDQDDFWLENKVIEAIKMIDANPHQNGTLYCSNLTLVDTNLKPFGMQEKKKILKAKKNSFLISNVATGCTIVINRSFYDHSTKYYPENIHLHDYWLFLIALYSAKSVYDFNSYIYYRQHQSNQIGSNKSVFTKSKFKELFHPTHSKDELPKQLLKGFEKDIPEEDLKYVKMVAYYKDSFKNKNRLLFSNKIRARRLDFVYRFRVLFKKF